MKFTAKILCLAAVALVSISANAQRGFDVFNIPKTVVIAAPKNFGATTGIYTNSPVDVRFFDGLATVDIFNGTNSGTTGGTLTATIETSSDTTNWTALSSYAVITSATSISHTNSANTNIVASDSFLLPGTYSTYVPASNLAAGVPLLPLPYTNSGAITISSAGYYKVGFSVGDSGRYLHIYFTPGGTVTNFTAGATLSGINESPLK